jgi:hypothetical protein
MVDYFAQLGRGRGSCSGKIGHEFNLLFASSSPRGQAPCLQGGSAGDAMKPGCNSLATPEGARFSQQDKKRGLKSILSILLLRQQPPAYAQHHRPVPCEQSVEGRLSALRQEALQKLAILGGRCNLAESRPTKTAQDIAKRGRNHRAELRTMGLLLFILPAGLVARTEKL